jgi:cytochrome c
LKKYYVAIALLGIVTACSNDKPAADKKDASATGTAAAPAVNDLSANPDYTKGLELIAKSDCLTCHKVSDKLTGPSYRDVAAKYENTPENVTLLAGKIIKGGQGVWSTIPMTPHATLSEADAEQMVKYIFLLKK